MAFNGAHAFFALGFLLLMVSGSAAAALGTCEFPSTTYRGRCQDNLCAAACHGEHFKGDTSKPGIGGGCSDYQRLDGGDGGYHVGPRCICIVDCGRKDDKAAPPPAEQYDPERRHRHHHHSPPPPAAQEPPAEKDEAESRYAEMWWYHHKSPPPPPAEKPPAPEPPAIGMTN